MGELLSIGTKLPRHCIKPPFQIVESTLHISEHNNLGIHSENLQPRTSLSRKSQNIIVSAVFTFYFPKSKPEEGDFKGFKQDSYLTQN